MITVYGAPPTRSLRVLWMLEEMGLSYEVRPVDFATREQDAEFTAINPAAAFLIVTIAVGAALVGESVRPCP